MSIQPIHYSELTPELMRSGCFVLDMPNDAYHSSEGVSKSGLDLIARSPAHYRYSVRRDPTRAMAIGSAIHCALLEPERFRDEYVLLRDVKDRRASEYKQAIKSHPAENVLVASEADNVAAMQESVFSQPEALAVLAAPGWRELSAFVECPVTEILLRCRFDLLTAEGEAYDLKKTQDARPKEFSKAVNNYRYHVQDAHYSRVFELITGYPLKRFAFIAVEEQPPNTTQVFELDALSKEVGKFYAMRDLKTYAQCEASGEWPHPSGGDGTITIPNWAVMQYEDDLEESIT
jgi:exodeoxyribonuclease VIII